MTVYHREQGDKMRLDKVMVSILGLVASNHSVSYKRKENIAINESHTW